MKNFIIDPEILAKSWKEKMIWKFLKWITPINF